MFRRAALLLTFVTTPALAQDTLEAGLETDLVLENVLTGLDRPTAAEFLPDGRILFVAQNSGDVFVYDEVTDLPPVNVGRLTIQSAGSERGLLGMAIDPDFAATGRVYFYLSLNNTQRVVWAQFDPQANTLDVNNTQLVLDGMASNANHNGGGIQFGPDGMLYIGVGDTGCNCNCSPGTNTDNYFGTCLTNFNGKILRVGPDGNVPNDGMNALIGETNVADCVANSCRQSVAPTPTGTPRTEIYNWGFRNPWRFSFDAQTGFMWIGDVGEITWEEITVSTGPNQHHGWPYREGADGQPVTACGTATPQSGDCKDPALQYPGQGSVTGGVFANHCSWPEPWRGRYFFGGYVQNRTWYLQPNAARDGVDGDRVRVVRHGAGGGPVHYFVGPTGAIYFTTLADGEIWRIRPANPEDCGMPDAGVERDGGEVTPQRDAGEGGVPRPRDAGFNDAGEAPMEDASGCGCSDTGRTSRWGALVLFALFVLRRRSR
ncbi:MAG: PQQ-dependent sugar dehydrogenase [Deltaproteobacteria bacterium]|jgi:glucose/arabinose dehydrogenase